MILKTKTKKKKKKKKKKKQTKKNNIFSFNILFYSIYLKNSHKINPKLEV